ncbi:hypothetical protein M3J09_010859 [Ascochyta lentis]
MLELRQVMVENTLPHEEFYGVCRNTNGSQAARMTN